MKFGNNDDDSFCSSSSAASGGSQVSSTDDQFPTNGSNSPKNNGGNDAESAIAKAENEAVLRTRLRVLGFLVVCTTGVACLVYFTSRNREQETFEAEFDDLASKVFDSLGTSIEASMAALDGFAVAIVSFAQFTNMTWPFVTIPDYGMRASKVRSITKSVLITQIQTVDNAEKERWNEYSLEKGPMWVDENIKIQNQDPTFHGVEVDEYLTSGIWGGGEPNGTAEGLHRPLWQNYPTVPQFGNSPFNLDLALLPGLTLALPSLNQGKVVVGGVSNDPNTLPSYNTTNELLKLYSGGKRSWDTTEPLSEMYYPIFGDVTDSVSGGSRGDAADFQQEGRIVSVIASWFYWHDLMTNMLPSGSNGIIAVFENDCKQTFTYQINGPKAVFLGFYDAHESKYNHMRVQSKRDGLMQYSLANGFYTGFPLSDDVCPYTVSVYPSQTFEDQSIHSTAVISMTVAISIFLFTIMIFLVYDTFVEKRQKKVMRTAVKSSAIVSSLFPSNVRARLYGNENDGISNDDPTDDDGMGRRGKKKNKLKTFMNDDKKGEEGQDHTKAGGESSGAADKVVVPTGRPIADLFPHATVLFADLAGFTAWSSTREPSQVFILLETLYATFDALALKRKVFKVETIGDCYMAVTGLPEPNPEHAVAAVKFAQDCRIQMVKLLADLAQTLGSDTENLAMRFGLNSGPVTAGVLRGQKSRFQLFGDTVNTASRMETTGHRNCIHVSESTAQELIKHEKHHWLTARKDPVEAKGKGTMKTFWVDPSGGISSNSSRGGPVGGSQSSFVVAGDTTYNEEVP